MSKLTAACRSGDAERVYKALRLHIAERLDNTDSGRDYAAIVKSFIDVQDRIDKLEPQAKREQPENKLALARGCYLRVVNE